MTILGREGGPPSAAFRGGSKPYVRWWWLAGPFRREAIRDQLEWAKAAGFGGVELAWLWPSWIEGASPGVDWLGPEWSGLVAFAKGESDRLGLGCDFTFGSCWPFGGSVVAEGDATRTFDGPGRRRLQGSWERPGPDGLDPPILNHLDRSALRRYASAMLPSFAEALRGSTSALFCDSLELDSRRLWDPKLYDRFAARHGYRLEGHEGEIDDDPALRYDYRSTLADAILAEFYEEFAAICRENGALARVQCHGAPTDLIAAYAAVDVPESEAILFDPPFSRVAASASALAGKPVVSAETFTCLYGFASMRNPAPYQYWRRERVADLKLLADSLFAQGINQVVWHGMPFNERVGDVEFYASVHVGPDASFVAEIPAFNAYLERVSALLKLGRAESRLAVYHPVEDNRRLDRIPDAERTPGAVYRWEMRHVVVPREAEGFAPLWISAPFLRRGEVVDGRLIVGDQAFDALLVDVEWLDGPALFEVSRIAEAGCPVILPRDPRSPGRVRRKDYNALVAGLRSRPNVTRSIPEAGLSPLVEGDDLPPFWARRTAEALYLFFAHPVARDVRYPLRYGQSAASRRRKVAVRVRWDGDSWPVDLAFGAHQSVLLRVSRPDGPRFVDIGYRPPAPSPGT